MSHILESDITLEMGILMYPVLLITFVVLMWTISSATRYYIKFILFSVLSLIAATSCIPIMLVKPRDSKNALMPALFCRYIASLLGLSYTVEGHENIIKGSGCVILINHQSALDLIILAYLWPIMDNCTVVSKKEVLYLQPFGSAAWLWGTLFINRSDNKDSRTKVSKTEQAIRNYKARILMFPEGTRNLKKKLVPFKKGAFHLALDAGCPIQPVCVSRYTFLGKNRFDNGHVHIQILPAISTKNHTKEDLPKLIDECYKTMSEHVELISTMKSS
ncbi:unnamed protein product [Brassicogethes aeneus]|uniref:1-acyl-sn-glycerol-3-phosphate acyltransferase n=1 Tax=Brassicogethes aeneus TaxID=1431903 RepID=A0A9P0BA62_BRAAE|nr:unnamed protein product [Brassicogethes aeneus]